MQVLTSVTSAIHRKPLAIYIYRYLSFALGCPWKAPPTHHSTPVHTCNMYMADSDSNLQTATLNIQADILHYTDAFYKTD